MKHWLVGLLLLIGPPAFAQQAVPSITFDSVPNPLRLPPNMYFGEVPGVSVNSKGHVFVLSRGNTSGPAYAAAATQLLEFDAKGSSSAKSARTSTPGRSLIPSRSILPTISGSPTRAPTW